jgi:hypothetical protein
MENIILIKVADQNKRKYYFLTWGRIFDRIDADLYSTIIRPHLTKFGIESAISFEVCNSLQEGAKAQYFYENFFMMCQSKIPFGKKYNAWQKSMVKKIKSGKEIYFLGA